MTTLVHGWTMDVSRGPDWLFVRPRGEMPPPSRARLSLAEEVWDLMQQSFCRRVVLELDDAGELTSAMLGQLAALANKVRGAEGTLRLAGLSAENERVLAAAELEQRLPVYPTREAAVRGERCAKPR